MYCIICEAYAGYLGYLFDTGRSLEWRAVEPQRNHHILTDHCHEASTFGLAVKVVARPRARRKYTRRQVVQPVQVGLFDGVGA
jgi:hypothetical protein